MPIFKVTGVFPNHKRKRPQKVSHYVDAMTPAYAKMRFDQATGRLLKVWKPIVVKKMSNLWSLLP